MKTSVALTGVTKVFEGKSSSFTALDDVSLRVNKGDIYGIIGMSGAGKSTLIRCINYLEKPTRGEVWIEGCNLGTLKERELRSVRKDIGMIFQNFNLLMQRTVLDNVCFPLEIAGTANSNARRRAMELLEVVGLSDKAEAYPAQLSGGQKQRTAIARALAADPKILLCDEATSALDPNTTESILELLKQINREFGITIILITHEMAVIERICTHVAIIEAGQVVEQGLTNAIFENPQTLAAKNLIQRKGA